MDLDFLDQIGMGLLQGRNLSLRFLEQVRRQGMIVELRQNLLDILQGHSHTAIVDNGLEPVNAPLIKLTDTPLISMNLHHSLFLIKTDGRR